MKEKGLSVTKRIMMDIRHNKQGMCPGAGGEVYEYVVHLKLDNTPSPTGLNNLFGRDLVVPAWRDQDESTLST